VLLKLFGPPLYLVEICLKLIRMSCFHILSFAAQVCRSYSDLRMIQYFAVLCRLLGGGLCNDG
jgi:hypothetical protein